MTANRVVLATHNAKKLEELRRLVADAGIDVVGLSEVADYPEPAETELTFEGNALLKATAAAQATGLPALADDSGLEVDVLNRMPGVRSARWAGPEGDDRANLELLLRQLHDVETRRRTARFVCVMAFAHPDGRTELQRGEVEGVIITEPRGSNGFGYDPIFVPQGFEQTTAELTAEAKDEISHRGRAVRAMVARLPELLAADSGEE
ncbi:RdgB/HAM1 family non-canonical purine NTP pyrophosphatase [Enemella sp. A6]|uniref:RdgB/HAM1 family non-canonical purine NTP pyrophosphatase n=1 Tax=Enemella sp. A6 TaxID=3440152 RepID=UPI003EBE4CFE